MNACKRIVILFGLVIIATSLPAKEKSASPPKQYGFQSLQFGASYQETVKYLNEQFYSNEKRRLGTQDNPEILLRGFDLGDRKMDVMFSFDRSNKFEGFMIFGPNRDMGSRDQALGEVNFLTRMFEKNYGKNYTCGASAFDEKVYCRWAHQGLKITTGIINYGNYFSAYGSVSKKMH